MLTHFAAHLFRALPGDQPNRVVSPYSVVRALGMALIGARRGTAEELCAALDVDDAGHLAERLATARAGLDDAIRRARAGGDPAAAAAFVDAVWLQRGLPLAAQFRAQLATWFRAEPQTADFATDPAGAAALINSFVAEHTDGRITDLADPDLFDELTRLVLVDAGHLRAGWLTPFSAPASDRPFRRADGSVSTVAMLRQRVDAAGWCREEGWQAARLPLSGGRLAMALVLPEEGRPLADLIMALTGAELHRMLTGFAAAPVDVTVPRWRFRTTVRLDESLADLGIRTAFDRGAADFSGITDADDLAIDTAVHQAYIAVDENGVEAAAATAVVMAGRSAALAPPEPKVMIFDRPFLFVIFAVRDVVPLFIGEVGDPGRPDA